MSGEIDKQVEERALRRQKPGHPILTNQSQRTNQKEEINFNIMLAF